MSNTKSKRPWWIWPLMLFVIPVAVYLVAAPKAVAGPVEDYADTYAYAVCGTLDLYPTIAGVAGVGLGIHNDGFTYEEAGSVIALAVYNDCPRHLPLLQRFIDVYGDGQVA